MTAGRDALSVETTPVDVALIQPPVAIPCEPPIGAAMLARRLRARGLSVLLYDGAVAALNVRLQAPWPRGESDELTWQRECRRAARALVQLRSVDGYTDRDRHRAAVSAVRRGLAARDPAGVCVGLADYDQAHLSPLCTRDLLQAAQKHIQSPFAGYFSELATEVALRAPRVVGLSVSYLHQALPVMALAGALKQVLPRTTPVLLGGALLRTFRERLTPHGLSPFVDDVCFDGGEALFERYLGGGAATASDGILPPDYRDIPWHSYLSSRRIVPVVSTLGCYYGRCNYCPEAVTQERFRMVPPQKFLASLGQLVEECEPGLFHLSDSAIPPAILRALAEQGSPVPWYGFVRFHRDLSDVRFARRLRQSGCVLLQLGLESGSARVLERLHKGIDLGETSRVLRALSDAGIATFVYVMFGTPGEERDDGFRTRDFVAQHAGHIRYLNVALLNLPSSAPAEPDVERIPFAGDHDLSLYSGFRARHGWDRRQARRFIEREFSREPLISDVLRRTPPAFGANHAPLLELAQKPCYA